MKMGFHSGTKAEDVDAAGDRELFDDSGRDTDSKSYGQTVFTAMKLCQ